MAGRVLIKARARAARLARRMVRFIGVSCVDADHDLWVYLDFE
jgi:hypothetical protein